MQRMRRTQEGSVRSVCNANNAAMQSVVVVCCPKSLPSVVSSQPKLCAECNAVAGTCNEHGHGSILDAELPPPQSQPTRVDIDVRQAGTTKVVFAAAETARRLLYLCAEHDHGTIFDASPPSAIPTHASGYGRAEGSGNQRCTRRSWHCAPNTVPVR